MERGRDSDLQRVSGFTVAKIALANIEQKLRRQLGLVGNIGATFTPNLTPVIIAGDLREPGNSAGFTGRSFAAAFVGAGGGANLFFSWRADAPLLIEEIWCELAAAGHTITWYLSIPGATPGVVATVPTGTYVDDKQTNELVPIQRSAGAGAGFGPLTGTASADTTTFYGGSGVFAKSARCRMMLPVGSHINIQVTGAGTNLAMGFNGRIWP